MDYVDDIKLQALSLQNGVTMRGRCPMCGISGSFAISRNKGGLVWKCHRAKCGYHGGTASREDTSGMVQRKREVPDVQATKLPSDIFDWLCQRYALEPETLTAEGVTFWKPHERVLLPIRDYSGKLFGYSARAVTSGYRGAKNLNIVQDTAWKGGAFTRTSRDSDAAVLVEDLFSAYSVAEFGYAGIALLGTHCTQELEEELVRYSEIIVALDNDATGKGAGIVRQLQYLNVRQLPLDKDLKDMTVQERLACLNEY